MTDQVWTKITFPAYALRILAVTAAIDEECPEEDDASVDDHAAPGTLAAIAGNTHDGFDSLEPVLKHLRIPYDRWTEADFERAELNVYYRPGRIKKHDYSYKQFCANGRAVVYIDELTELLRTARNGAVGEKALKALADNHNVPSLIDLIKPPERLKNHLTLPDPAVLKDYDIRLSANAVVSGSLRVTATSAEEAHRLAQDRVGNVIWKYNCLDDTAKPVVIECRVTS